MLGVTGIRILAFHSIVLEADTQNALVKITNVTGKW